MAVIVKRLSYTTAGTGGGGDTSGYIFSFNASSWVLNGDSYEIKVLKTTHNRTNPQVMVFELIGSSFEEVIASVNLDTSDNITISVSSSPDLRFSGKLIIK
jgi:hypothetical protein